MIEGVLNDPLSTQGSDDNQVLDSRDVKATYHIFAKINRLLS